MIEPMKRVSVLAQESRKGELIEALQELAVLHLTETRPADSALTERFATVLRLSQELKEYLPKGSKGSGAGKDAQPVPLLSDEEFERQLQQTLETREQKAQWEAQAAACRAELDRIKPWGEFSPEGLASLEQAGLPFRFYQISKKEYSRLEQDPSVSFVRLAPYKKQQRVAVLGELGAGYTAVPFPVPKESCSALQSRMEECSRQISNCEEALRRAALCYSSYQEQLLRLQNRAETSAVENTVEEDRTIIWLTGYIPEAAVPRFREAAREHGWAWALEDPAEDDSAVPTQVRYTKVSRLIRPVFDLLGTVPGYREYDISFWFLAFFTLFFAMIIGDAGYGCLFLVGAVIWTVRSRKTTDVTLLLYVLSVAAIVWGAMTGTWFGSAKAMEIPFLRALVIPGFANYPEAFDLTNTVVQNNVMKLSFTIGTVQLALACVMNIRRKARQKDLSWVADVGWLAAIVSLYFVILYLVIGQEISLAPAAAIVIAGFLLVVVFGGMGPGKTFRQGLKAGLGDAFTVFLNTISAFGNIMSYIRLFAVGMSSLAIAQSFNDMASGLHGPLLIAGVLLVVAGHTINIVMGLLSVVVHGVRLNLLEFAGQLNMEWSGIPYDPFRKRDKLKQ